MSVPSLTPPSKARSRGDDAASDDVTADAHASELHTLRARVSELETALDQKDAELYEVRRQYEAILDDRDQATSSWLDALVR